jgi:hypothetical protein
MNEFKQLSKKYKSLSNDLLVFEKVIKTVHDDVETKELFFNGKRATVLQKAANYEVIKARLDCKSISKSSPLRITIVIIFSNNEAHYLEIFTKAGKEREDDKRIKQFLKEKSFGIR